MIGKKNHNKNIRKSHAGYLAKHIHFQTIDSTNTWAKQHSSQWAPQGVTLVSASEQTAGRGRFKRRWESPPNVNIYATFCFWFEMHRTDVGNIPQILALAASQTLETFGFFPKIKWPNDVLLNGKKVAGILCETLLDSQKWGIVCGIGLNVNMPLKELEQIDRPATSLYVERGEIFEIVPIFEKLQELFLSSLHTFIQNGFQPFFPLLQARSALQKGQFVQFHDNQNLLNAQFEAWKSDGSVELRLSDGTLKIFYAGEFIT